MKNKIKRTIILFGLFASFVLPAFSQVRDYVGIVRREFSQAHLDFQEAAKPVLTKKEQEAKDKADAAEEALRLEKGETKVEYNKFVDKDSFGSGFVVVLKDGTNLVITNNHVVQNCTRAMIEFINDEKSVIYDHLEVIATSEDLDLAVLVFPNGEKPFTKGIPFSSKKVTDGDEVWSAGYPALRNKPEWQLAKGNVSSANAKVEELMDSKITTIIQHSSPIDAGNSGGPLLEKDSSSVCGYSVVGINTWKAYNRELTGFTIPSSIIEKYIEQAFNHYNLENGEELVKERAQKFFDTLTKVYKTPEDLEKYISTNYFDNISYDYVMNVIESTGNYLLRWRMYSDKLAAKRTAIAHMMWSKYSLVDPKKDKDSTEKYDFIEIKKIDGNKFEVSYEDSSKQNVIKSVWEEDMQQWKICSISFTKDSKKFDKEKKDNKLKSKKYKSSDKDSGLFIFERESFSRLIYTIPMNIFDVPITSDSSLDKHYKGFTFDTQNYFNGWFAPGFEASWQLTNQQYFKMAGIDLNLHLPINCVYFRIVPHAAVGGVICLFSDSAYYGWYWEGDIALTFSDGEWGFGANFKTTYLYPMRDEGANYQIPTVGLYFMLRN